MALLMTPARTEALTTASEEIQRLTRVIRGWEKGDADEARAQIEALTPVVQSLSVMAEIDKKFAEIEPFFGLYADLKPEAVRVLATVIDEGLDVLMQVANSVTRYDEFRKLQAESTRRTYEAYLAVGFDDAQAFACTLRTMELFDETVKRSFANSNIKLKK